MLVYTLEFITMVSLTDNQKEFLKQLDAHMKKSGEGIEILAIA
jgi:hypothetical protein